jgi:hypothetical protein
MAANTDILNGWREAIQTITNMRDCEDGPEVPDGHDWEGFVGGCQRFGCGENCNENNVGGDK